MGAENVPILGEVFPFYLYLFYSLFPLFSWVLSSPLSGGVCVPGSQDRNVTGRTVQMDFVEPSGKEKEKSPHCFLMTP